MSISQDKAQKKKMLHIYFAPRAFSPRQMPSVTRSISQGQKLVSRQTLGVHEIINSNFLRIMEKNPAISTIFFSELLFPDPEILASKTIFRDAGNYQRIGKGYWVLSSA